MAVKKGSTVVLAGTKKGLFVAHSENRKRWKVEGPYFEGLPIYHAMSDGKTTYASVSNEHWGPSVQRSASFGAKWAKHKSSPSYAESTKLSVDKVWQIAKTEDGTLYAGVEPAGLFVSRDDGATWEEVEGFNRQPREGWFPGGGGLCLHTILPYPGNASRMLVAASAVGIFGTGDGGKSWRVMNGGIRADFMPEGETREDQVGSCPHKLVRDAKDPDVVYMQNHCGVYRRKRGDAKWMEIKKGLPARFGFPMAAHPHDGGTVYTLPLESDRNRVTIGGAPAVYRTTNGGKSWEPFSKGLPKSGAWWTVLRDAMATDQEDKAGVYFGTTTGQLYASRDEGKSWDAISETLPPILSVSTATVR